jgi:hypothetical protein
MTQIEHIIAEAGRDKVMTFADKLATLVESEREGIGVGTAQLVILYVVTASLAEAAATMADAETRDVSLGIMGALVAEGTISGVLKADDSAEFASKLDDLLRNAGITK